MLPNRTGRFRAIVTQSSVGLIGKDSKKLAVGGVFRLTHELVAGEWQDIEGENLEISNNFYLQKNDSTLNAYQIDTFKDTFGWDGRDPFKLETIIDAPCQLTLDWDTYLDRNNVQQSKIGIKFLNNYDYEGGFSLPTATEAERKQINAELGAKFRALAGSAPTKAAPPKQAPPAATKPAATAPPSASAPSLDDSWAKFCEVRSDLDDATREAAWLEMLKGLGITDTSALSTAQLAAIAEAAEVPF